MQNFLALPALALDLYPFSELNQCIWTIFDKPIADKVLCYEILFSPSHSLSVIRYAEVSHCKSKVPFRVLVKFVLNCAKLQIEALKRSLHVSKDLWSRSGIE